jgi:hypothetical protein
MNLVNLTLIPNNVSPATSLGMARCMFHDLFGG